MSVVQSVVGLTFALNLFCVGCLLAGLSLLQKALLVLRKGPRAVFCTKKRPAPPVCLQDPGLGVHGYAHLTDVRLHYVSNGPENKPLMLLVHGFPEFWYSWRHQLKAFKQQYRVVAVDQRGYGDSDKPPYVWDYTLPKLTNDLRQLISALGYEKCVLVGHDWGGVVAWSLAQTCPQVVERLIVMNCPSMRAYFTHVFSPQGLGQIKKSLYIALFQVPWMAELNLRLSDLQALDLVFKGKKMGLRSDSMTDQDVEAYKYTFQRNGFTGPLNYYRALVRYSHPVFQLSRATCKVTCPTLIIWGCKDGALEKRLAELSMDSVAGKVSVKYIEDSSHWTPMDRFEDVNSYMREFFNLTA